MEFRVLQFDELDLDMHLLRCGKCIKHALCFFKDKASVFYCIDGNADCRGVLEHIPWDSVLVNMPNAQQNSSDIRAAK